MHRAAIAVPRRPRPDSELTLALAGARAFARCGRVRWLAFACALRPARCGALLLRSSGCRARSLPARPLARALTRHVGDASRVLEVRTAQCAKLTVTRVVAACVTAADGGSACVACWRNAPSTGACLEGMPRGPVTNRGLEHQWRDAPAPMTADRHRSKPCGSKWTSTASRREETKQHESRSARRLAAEHAGPAISAADNAARTGRCSCPLAQSASSPCSPSSVS